MPCSPRQQSEILPKNTQELDYLGMRAMIQMDKEKKLPKHFVDFEENALTGKKLTTTVYKMMYNMKKNKPGMRMENESINPLSSCQNSLMEIRKFLYQV